MMRKYLFVFFTFLLVQSAMAAVTGITFTTEPQTIAVGEISGRITVSSGTAVGETADLFLSSPSATGEFSSSNTNWQTVTQLVWNSNWANRSFYYRDSTVGVYTIAATLTTRVSQQSWTATQAITVGTSSPPVGDGDGAGGGDGGDGDNLGDESDVSAHARPTDLSPAAAKSKKPLTVDPGRKRLVIVGAPLYLRAKVSNAAKEPGVRIYWSLGDGGSAFGPETIHQYSFPGTYIVVVNALQAGEEAAGRTVVEVVEPQAAIEEVGFSPRPYIKVINRSPRELNLGYWQIRSGEKTLTLPADTLIAGNSKIYLPIDPARISLSDAASLDLLYPSGRLADSKKLVAEEVAGADASPELSEETEALVEQITRLNGEIKAAVERVERIKTPSQPSSSPISLQTQTAAVAAASQLSPPALAPAPAPAPTVIEISRPAGPVKRSWSFVKGLFGAADKR